MKRIIIAIAAAALLAGFAGSGAAVAHESPNCEGALGSAIANHGQHVVGDYVTGLGAILGTGQEWPPTGIGQVVKANGGPAIEGGAGPGLHFLIGFEPGASFCTQNAHPNGFEAPDNIPTPGQPN